jgi:hypothetical protein
MEKGEWHRRFVLSRRDHRSPAIAFQKPFPEFWNAQERRDTELS